MGKFFFTQFLDRSLTSMSLISIMFFVSRAQDRDQCLILILSNFKESLVNLRDGKLRTLLHIAAYQNSVACFKVLLNNGATINLKDQYSRTPLMLACYMGHQRIVGKTISHTLIHKSIYPIY